MKGEKDGGKQMVPLFPGLRINGGGDKMASESSRSMLLVPPGIGCSTFVPPTSSSTNGSWEVPSAKRKLRPTLDFSVPSFLQSGKTLNHRNLHSVCLKLSNEANSEDRTVEKHGNEENSKLSQNDDLIKKWTDDKDCVASKVKKEEILDIFMDGSIPGLNLATDQVVRVIGQRLFLKARKIMVHQQKVFSLQMFELHRLVTVQRLMARSLEILHENNKPSIKFPPMNKLLYVSPLDTSPSLTKTKPDAPSSDPVMDCGTEAIHGLIPLSKTNVEKGLSTLKTLGPLTNPTSIPIDPKLAPWCFPPPPGNQWLIPVQSPSEGLVYKPYPGPCFSTVGFLGPVYGNCRPMSLSSMGPTCGVPNKHGSGGFYGPELSQNYFQPYPMPLINATGSNHEIKPVIGVQEDDGPGSPERLERDGLCLFPTTPSLLKDQRNEQRVEVIKVVPHNRNSAPASAARIFQSIQEERRKLK